MMYPNSQAKLLCLRSKRFPKLH